MAVRERVKAEPSHRRWSAVVVGRQSGAWIGSAFVHGALLAAALAYAPAAIPAVEPAIEIEVVELTTMPSPASPVAEDSGTSADVTVVAPSPPPPPARVVPATRKPAKPRTTAPADPIPPEEPTTPDPVPVATEPSSTPPVAVLARPVPITRGFGEGSTGSGAGFGGDEDAFDGSAYGAEIVRILKAEIDRHPVPGIGAHDSIQLVLTLLPNGELAWTREGRFGFAEVLRSSLGPLRMRQVLKRIEIASERFPPHPHGLRSRQYTVDITIRFSKPKR